LLDRLLFVYSANGKEFTLDTQEVKALHNTIAIDDAEVLSFIKQMIKENIVSINGGSII